MRTQSAGASVRRPCVALALSAALVVAPAAARAGDAVNTGYFGDVAIKGYDPVAYFVEGRPMKGSEDYSHKWLGVTWYFASAAHRDLFIEDPTRYAPQYGGFCAIAVAFNGEISNIDPKAWDIVDGKLYLQYSRAVREEWHTDIKGLIELADENWPEIEAARISN